MPKIVEILHLEDDTSDAGLVRLKLEAAGIDARITRVRTRKEFEKALDQCGFEVILADHNLPGYNGLTALKLTQEVCPAIPFIFVSGMMTEDVAIEALTQGAVDYVFKENLARLGPAIERALEHAANQRERQRAEEKFTYIFQISPVPMSISTFTEGRIVDVNNAYLAMLGYTREELIGHTSLELGIWDDWQDRQALVALKNGISKLSNIEVRFRTKDRILVLCNASFTIFEVDGAECILTTLEDITERRRTEQALKDSEEKFRTFADESPNMIFINRRGRVVYVNHKCEEMMGYSKEEFYAPEFSFQSITAPEDVAKLEDYFRQHLGGNDVPSYEYTVITKDGRRIEVIIATKLIPYENERAILGIITDITEWKRAEQELAKAQSILAAALEQSPAGVMIANAPDGKFRLVNKAAEEIVMMSEADMLQISMANTEVINWQCFRPDGTPYQVIDLPLPQTILTGQTFSNVEMKVRRHDGSERWILTNGAPIRNEKGEIIGGIIEFPDITEHKQVEEASREVQALYHSFVEQMPAGVFRKDSEGRYIFVNKVFCELKGLKAEEIVGKTPIELSEYESTIDNQLPPEKARRQHTLANQGEENHRLIMQTGKSVEIEEIYSQPDGTTQYFQIVKSPVFSADGKVIGSQGIQFDITDRKLAQEALGRQLKHLRALHTINQAIIGSLDLKRNLDLFLQQFIEELNVDAADILLFNPHMHTLEDGSSVGFQNEDCKQLPERLGEGYTGQAALSHRMVYIKDLAKAGYKFARSAQLAREGFCDYFGIPLTAKGELLGVLEIFHRTPLATDSEWIDLLEALADQAAISIDNAQLFMDLQRTNIELEMAYNTTLEGWSAALDLRDKETEGHTQRVTEITVQLARAVGLSAEEILHVRRGALLHDIGKMGIPDAILMKAEALSEAEWAIMRKHPVYAYELLYAIKYLHPAIDIPYCHHEKWDGSGYPRALKKEQIPLAARIFAVVDVWDALTSDRPYRVAMSRENALKEIRAGAGCHFDPHVVELFMRYLKDKK